MCFCCVRNTRAARYKILENKDKRLEDYLPDFHHPLTLHDERSSQWFQCSHLFYLTSPQVTFSVTCLSPPEDQGGLHLLINNGEKNAVTTYFIDNIPNVQMFNAAER